MLLVVARGFPRCKPNRIPGKMPEDKMLENKMSENGKPDKMPDNVTGTLTLTGSGPFMSQFTHTHTHTHTHTPVAKSFQLHSYLILYLEFACDQGTVKAQILKKSSRYSTLNYTTA